MQKRGNILAQELLIEKLAVVSGQTMLGLVVLEPKVVALAGRLEGVLEWVVGPAVAAVRGPDQTGGVLLEADILKYGEGRPEEEPVGGAKVIKGALLEHVLVGGCGEDGGRESGDEESKVLHFGVRWGFPLGITVAALCVRWYDELESVIAMRERERRRRE